MNDEPLHQLVYVSSATALFSLSDLLALLEQSRQRNAEVHVTGMLLYREGNFMQVLEGRPDAVAATHARIQADPRHRGLITLRNAAVAARSFPHWSMAYRNLELGVSDEIPGYSDFLNQQWELSARNVQADAARKLVDLFRKGMRG